ncbi:MAG: PilZ domain-containing protein [Nitrospirae bacterium]|nr:PilZ domain-containing protein [Nitrospirota bacterium]
MGARGFDRINVLIAVKINCHNRTYDGTVINLSESGMLIRINQISSLINSHIEISITLEEEMLNLYGRLVRQEDISGYYNGIGVEIINPPQKYLDFIDSLIAVL